MKTHRHSPLPLTATHTLKNRIVVPPMASGTANTSGIATEKTITHYRKLTESGAGLVIAEYTFVHASGRSEEHQLGISSDAHLPGLAQIAEAIHLGGALAGIQLSHGGGKSSRELTGGDLLGPSAIAVPVKGSSLETPRAMTLEEIKTVKESYLEAAGRAAQAGFDLVELHSAHGYGLNQFLSPLTNKRQDKYGYDRSRLLREIIRAVQERHPELLISVRMPGQDFLEGGLNTSQALKIAQMLEAEGVDLVHVSSGIGGWRRPSVRTGEGYLVAEAALIQAQLLIPVIGVGGIETGAYIDQSLAERNFSLAAVGRAILKDPQAWRQQNLDCAPCKVA